MSKVATIIGIAGASGAGKSLLASELYHRVGKNRTDADVQILHEDSYYRDQSHLEFHEREQINYDHPSALEHSLLTEHLQMLRSDTAANVPQYDYSQHNRKPETVLVSPARVLIIEGILILHDVAVRELLDLKIFVDVPLDICLARRLRRDIQERGRTLQSVLSQYEKTVRPMYFEFTEPTKHHADIIVPRGGENESALNVLHGHVERILS